MSSKELGTYGEIQVALKAIEQGFTVCTPMMDSRLYDIVLEKHGRFCRIQVKSTVAAATDGSISFRSRRTAQKTEPYKENDFDVVAFYSIDLDLVYLFPISFVVGKTRLTVRPDDPKCKYLLFKNNWGMV